MWRRVRWYVELDIIMAMFMKIYFSRDLTPCTLVRRIRHHGDANEDLLFPGSDAVYIGMEN